MPELSRDVCDNIVKKLKEKCWLKEKEDNVTISFLHLDGNDVKIVTKNLLIEWKIKNHFLIKNYSCL